MRNVSVSANKQYEFSLKKKINRRDDFLREINKKMGNMAINYLFSNVGITS